MSSPVSRRLVLIALCALAFGCAKSEAPAPAATQSRKVIFIGLDGADWQLLDRLIADGTMPNLGQLAREGDRRDLRTQHPPLSPLIWTTMMTGVSPLEHRVLDFTRFHPTTRQLEPITSDERAVPAVWNIASYAGKRVAAFGLWATYPAEEVNGVVVSDRLFSFQYDEATPPPGAVFPAKFAARAATVVNEERDRTGFDTLQRLVPSLTREEYDRLAASGDPFAHPITALRRIVIETAVIDRLAREVLASEKPDLAIIYFQGTDAIGHLFAPYFPPQLAGVSDADFARYRDVPRAYFARIDELLGDYRKLAAANGAELVIASDHGFHWIDQRSPVSSIAPATAAKWHREDGIFLQWPGRANRTLRDIADITPLLLDLLQIPNDPERWRRQYRRARTEQATPAASNESIDKLKALGYLGADTPAPRGTTTRTPASFNNEALLLLAGGRAAEAEAAFATAAEDPRNASARWNLSELLRKRNPARADRLLDEAIAIDDKQPRWLLVRARHRLAKQDCRSALADFTRAATLDPNDAIAHAGVGTASMCLGDEPTARRALVRSLAIHPNQPEVRRALQQLQ